MKKSSNTKKTFAASVISMLLCVVMLIGATFAWFTDSVVSGRNVIEAGNLDVELEYKGAGGTYTEVEENTKLFAENVLWEPGHVEYVNLKVSNKGKLALKYQLSVKVDAETPGTNVNEESFKLSDYLQYAVVDEANTYTSDSAGRQEAIADATAAGTAKLSELSITKENELSSTGGADEVTLIVYMPESVGNEANYKTGTTAPSITLGVNLVATQTPSESDSFGKDYDDGAKLPVMDNDSLVSSLQSGGAVTAKGSFAWNEAVSMTGDTQTALNLDPDAIVTVTEDGIIDLNDSAQLIINGTGKMEQDMNSEIGYLIRANENSKVTITDGTYIGGLTCVQAGDNAQVEIYGGHFEALVDWNDTYWLLNLIDNSNASITVYGGTFVNFDPSDSATENPHANFVADGYKVVSEEHGTDTWYTVVPE